MVMPAPLTWSAARACTALSASSLPSLVSTFVVSVVAPLSVASENELVWKPRPISSSAPGVVAPAANRVSSPEMVL